MMFNVIMGAVCGMVLGIIVIYYYEI
jgi:hypothetical protein